MSKNLGHVGEELVQRYYEGLGFRIVHKNFIAPFGKQTGELDLIVMKDTDLVFVEVKTRTSTRFGGPFEAIDQTKQRKLVMTAKIFLKLHPEYKDHDIRFDVAGVDVDNIVQPVIILMNAIEDLD
jgi:putative endonuclease